jgi:hypothetical protein
MAERNRRKDVLYHNSHRELNEIFLLVFLFVFYIPSRTVGIKIESEKRKILHERKQNPYFRCVVDMICLYCIYKVIKKH